MAFYIEDIQRPPVYKMQFTGFRKSLQMKTYTLESFRNTFEYPKLSKTALKPAATEVTVVKTKEA